MEQRMHDISALETSVRSVCAWSRESPEIRSESAVLRSAGCILGELESWMWRRMSQRVLIMTEFFIMSATR